MPARILNQKLADKWRDRVSMPLEDIDPENPAHLALLNDQGMSFNTIERIYGISHSVAHKTVRNLLGRKGRTHKFTLSRVVCEEYLLDERLPAKHKQAIAQWLTQNAATLQRLEGRYMTRKQENDLLRREQSDEFTGEFWVAGDRREDCDFYDFHEAS